jgi:hypothetical protein
LISIVIPPSVLSFTILHWVSLPQRRTRKNAWRSKSTHRML